MKRWNVSNLVAGMTVRATLIMLAAAPAAAQTAGAPGPSAPSAPASVAEAPAADAALYQDLGGSAGIATLMNDFVPRLKADSRIGHFFEKTNLPELTRQLADQICAVAGGPCAYRGAPMKTAHADFEIRRADFNALVELLQESMQARGIAFRTQNRLLARLAPMHRDIVNTR